MKNKVEIETNGALDKRIAEINEVDGVVTLSYLEKPGISILIKFGKNYVQIQKKGAICISVNHKIGETIEIEYRINNGGYECFGTSKIKTINYLRNEGNYLLEYVVNNEKIVQRWVVK